MRKPNMKQFITIGKMTDKLNEHLANNPQIIKEIKDFRRNAYLHCNEMTLGELKAKSRMILHNSMPDIFKEHEEYVYSHALDNVFLNIFNLD